jgi:hypothetical protein
LVPSQWRGPSSGQTLIDFLVGDVGYFSVDPQGTTLWLAELSNNDDIDVLPSLTLIGFLNFSALEVRKSQPRQQTQVRIVEKEEKTIIVEQRGVPTIKGIPVYIWNLIAQGLSAQEVLNICASSATYYQICQQPEVWQALLERDFPDLATINNQTQKEQDPAALYRAALTSYAHTTLNVIGIAPELRGYGLGCVLLRYGEEVLKRKAQQKLKINQVNITLESVFPNHVDDRSAQFYGAMQYKFRGLVMGALWFGKQMKNLLTTQRFRVPQVSETVLRIHRVLGGELITCQFEEKLHRIQGRAEDLALEISKYLGGYSSPISFGGDTEEARRKREMIKDYSYAIRYVDDWERRAQGKRGHKPGSLKQRFDALYFSAIGSLPPSSFSNAAPVSPYRHRNKLYYKNYKNQYNKVL